MPDLTAPSPVPPKPFIILVSGEQTFLTELGRAVESGLKVRYKHISLFSSLAKVCSFHLFFSDPFIYNQ